MSIRDRFIGLRKEVASVASAANRDPQSVAILAVTKGHGAAAVREAIAAGVTQIGENYVQEARSKFAGLTGVRKHFIGHVQTNKAPAIAQMFDVVQSVDRLEAGVALAKAAERIGKQLQVLIQLNISRQERFGCRPCEALELAQRLRALPALRVDGVMAIGPNTRDRAALDDAFAQAAATFASVGGETLSIGMSADWQAAVRAGSTLIRIGTALFGPRPLPPVSKPGVQWTAPPEMRRT